MSSSPFKASKITGAGPISEGPSGYFAWKLLRPDVSERFVRNGSPYPVFVILTASQILSFHTWGVVKYY